MCTNAYDGNSNVEVKTRVLDKSNDKSQENDKETQVESVGQ